MDRRVSPLTYVFTVLVALGVLLGATITAPHDRYHRFQSVDFVTTRKADWIYERLHFDATPIDVALIGTSRMGAGLSSPRIERRYCEATGRRIRVANLSIPATGRNMHYAIAKELYRTKQPALTIIELNEVEARKPHSAFVLIADASDVLTAPALINTRYLQDMIRLPGRQLELFFNDALGRAPLNAKFDPARYHGSHLDRTQRLKTITGEIISRDKYVPADELNTLARARRAGQADLFVLPAPLRRFEYRLPRIYLNKIRARAAAAHSDIEFLYLPAYQGETVFPPALRHELEITEPIIRLDDALPENSLMWLDATHVNANGADRQTEAFAKALIDRRPSLGVEGACD